MLIDQETWNTFFSYFHTLKLWIACNPDMWSHVLKEMQSNIDKCHETRFTCFLQLVCEPGKDPVAFMAELDLNTFPVSTQKFLREPLTYFQETMKQVRQEKDHSFFALLFYSASPARLLGIDDTLREHALLVDPLIFHA